MTDSSLDQARAERRRRIAERRRNRPSRFDTTIPSPCIAVCQIDDTTGCCIGCFRAIDEIREWPILTAEQKTEILERIVGRKAAAGLSPDQTPGK